MLVAHVYGGKLFLHLSSPCKVNQIKWLESKGALWCTNCEELRLRVALWAKPEILGPCNNTCNSLFYIIIEGTIQPIT